jgi:hypothetical protein
MLLVSLLPDFDNELLGFALWGGIAIGVLNFVLNIFLSYLYIPISQRFPLPKLIFLIVITFLSLLISLYIFNGFSFYWLYTIYTNGSIQFDKNQDYLFFHFRLFHGY